MKDIIREIERTIARHDMLNHGDRVLVAVSGGPDSVVLLDVLDGVKAAFSLDLVVAHFDHGLRPKDDERETRFAASLAVSKNLPFVTEKVISPMGKNGMSLEEEARNRRYEFLEHAKKKYTAQKIALGHTLDDQAETVIMRLLRGSGSAGLAGIPPVRDYTIIRPLIEITREEILAYIAHRKLQYITDSSNFEERHLRNRIRMDLLPRMKRYQPRIVHLLGQTAGIMREESRWLEMEADRWIQETVRVDETESHLKRITTTKISRAKTQRRKDFLDFFDGKARNKVLMSPQAFSELAPALQGQVIRQIIKRIQGDLRRISLRHIEAVKGLVRGRPQGTLNLPNGIFVQKTYETLIIGKNEEKPADEKIEGFHYVLDGPGVFRLDAIACTITIEEVNGKGVLPEADPSPWIAYLNRDRIRYPLIVRSFLPGDRFVPLGMRGHKKLKNFFVDRKVPSDIRRRLPLLCRGNDLIWVCGLRLDDRFKVIPEAEKVVRVSLFFHGGNRPPPFRINSITATVPPWPDGPGPLSAECPSF